MRFAGALAVAAVAALGCKEPQFPHGFMWGASVAGFQVDMGCPTLPAQECEDRGSDWYQFVSSQAQLSDLNGSMSFEPVSRGPGHWELYETDHTLAKEGLGLNAFRLSIEWSRVFPTPTDAAADHAALLELADQNALATYRLMLASLKAKGLTPLVTINHYTLPSWLHDAVGCHQNLDTCTRRGWLDRERAVREAAKYAGFIARELGGDVDWWATVNEPFGVVLPGYLLPSKTRLNPPAVLLRYNEAKQAMVSLIEAHARMYDAVKANDTVDADGDGQNSQVGLVYAMVPIRPKTPGDALDEAAARNVFYLYNTVFLDAVLKGDLDANLSGRAMHRDDLAGRADYLGINYYWPLTVKGTAEPQLPAVSSLSTFDVTDFKVVASEEPQGLYEVVTHVKDRYGLPIVITENGVADVDDASGFMVRHLAELARARADGADVRGYFYWSLIDNYEWNHGMAMKFGLYAIDPNDSSKARIARPAVETYRAITREGGVPEALAKQYPAP